MDRMKRYKVNDEYTILSGLPYSFQISSKTTSFRLVDHQDDPEADYPHPIMIETESLNPNHMLLYTPRKYMRINWYDDPDEPNGQIDMGIRTPDASLDFASWITLANSIPNEVITMAYQVITAPETLKDYEIPILGYKSSNNNNNNNPPPPPPPKVNANNNNTTKKKKKKFKVRQSALKN
jgi:hypothetical protein